MLEVFDGLEVKTQNPTGSYKVMGKLTQKIYKAKRKSDNQVYAMKSIAAKNLNEQELLKLKNELLAVAKL